MKRIMTHGLILSLSAGLLVACGGTDSSSSSNSKLLATTTACYAAWDSTTAYNGGATVSYNSVNYTAAFWTQGDNPSTNNGPAGSGQPWVNNGACGSTSTTPTLTEPSSISTGSNLSVSYSVPSSQASSTNWIGVYAAGVTPGSGTKALTWVYAPNASGSVTVNTSGLAAGNYAVWYLYNDGYTVLKGPQSLAISSSAPTMTEPTSINAGSSLSVTYSVPSSQLSAKNWIGVYRAGVTPGSGTQSSAWAYAPNASGSVTVNTSGLAAGSYAVWYLYNDGYTVLSGPKSLSIASSNPTISEPSSINAGSNLTVTYSVPSAKLSSTNWVGVYPAGVTPSSSTQSSAWAYAPNASGSVTVNTSGLAGGSYAVWYLYNDGYSVLSGPQNLAIKGGSLPGWTLGWSDEFNGTSLDTSKWNIEVHGHGYGNNELEYYTNRTQNVSVSGGNLVITARQESYTGPDGTRSYTSGRINSSGKFSQTYGRIEARMKLPVGQGVWPAFWMLGANIDSVSWPACGEIDVLEHINTESVIHGTIHWTDYSGNHAQYGLASGNVDVTQWHVYAVEWDANLINWYVDGTQYMAANIQNNINNTGAFHKPFFMILNLAVGGDWPGAPNGSVAFPQQMLVDYVRVYHK